MPKHYLSRMNGRLQRATLIAAVMVAGIATSAGSVRAADGERARDRSPILALERWLAPKSKPPEALPNRPQVARPQPPQPLSVRAVKPAPPVVLPNGQVVPNLPPSHRGVVPGGRPETSGDRAARCAHQAGLYGVPLDQRTTYMHSCTR